MMQNDFAKEAEQTFAIVYRNGNAPLMRPDYPPGTWEGMVRAAHLSKNIECFFVLEGTEEAGQMAADRQAILDRNAEPDEIEEIIFQSEAKDETIAGLKETNQELTDRLAKQQAQINELLARAASNPSTLPTTPLTPVGEASLNQGSSEITREYLMGLNINELRPLAVAYSTSGAGTQLELVDRILMQVSKGVTPK